MQRPDRLRIGRRLEWAYYITEYIDLPAVNLPAIEFDFDHHGPDRIEEIADELREFWNVGFGPVTDLAPFLEYNGIIVIEEVVNCEDMVAVSRWRGGPSIPALCGGPGEQLAQAFQPCSRASSFTAAQFSRSEQPKS